MVERTREYPPGECIPGTVYQVTRLIGAGGMGTVYDVEDTTIGKRYVLKTLHPHLGSRDDLARRMQSEARTLARLNHPNVVDVITAGVTGDDLHLPYYVMERLNGQSLRLVLEKKGQLELPHAYHIGIDLLDALDHAHDKGVIHRDVKPDNIFLHRTPAGVTVTKLLDFGILSLLDTTTRETAGRFLGTLRYAAPEQLRGERPTPKVDVYAAALVVYEILAGRGPFDEEGDPRRIAAAHLERRAPPLSRFVAVPHDLEVLLAAALAKAPEARPRDAFSFAASLRNLKRALAGAQARETTDNRSTAAAVLATESRPAVLASGQRSPADGPYVVSPSAAAPSAVSLSPTTIVGMTSPTVGPALARPAPSATGAAGAAGATGASGATGPGGVDRLATTGTFSPDTSPAPQNETDALDSEEDVPWPAASSFVPPPPPNLPPPGPGAPLRWPREQAVIQSEEPQFQMVSAGAGHSKRSAAGKIAGAVTVLGLALAGLLAGRRAAHPADGAPSRAAVDLSPPRAPEPVWPPPAPTLTPPFLDDGVAAEDAAPPAPSASHAPKSRPPAKKTKSAPAPSAERPGPGF